MSTRLNRLSSYHMSIFLRLQIVV